MRSFSAQVHYNALALRPGGSGVQTYIRELLRAVAAGWPAATLSAVVQNDAVAELPSSVRAILRPVSSGITRAVLGLEPVRDAQLVHGLDVDLPLASKGIRVATVHDLSVIDVPWASSRIRSWGERRLLKRAFESADVLLAVSSFTAERVHALCGKICHVTHLAPAPWAQRPATVDVDRVRTKFRLPPRFVLQVGTVEPRKDVHLLAAACRAVDIPLVLAGGGSVGPLLPDGVIGLGYVDVADLPALYCAATAVAYCSIYEGFGLPPVEAMACGAAVVASSVGALPDVVGDGAALVTRHDVEAWAGLLRDVVHDSGHAQHLRVHGPDAAASLTWHATAQSTVEAYGRAGLTF